MSEEEVFVLYIEIRGASLFLPKEPIFYLDYFETVFQGKPLPPDWEPPAHFETSRKKPVLDFVRGSDAAPYISERARDALMEVCNGDAEFQFTGTIRGKPYFVMNVITVVNCLDKSKARSSIDDGVGQIPFYWNYPLVKERIPKRNVFKIPEDLKPVFVRKAFVDIVVEKRLTGVGFEDPKDFSPIIKRSVVPGLPFR